MVPEAKHVHRLQERLSSKGHSPRERQDTVGNGDCTRRLTKTTKTTKIGASPSNTHAEATSVTCTPGANLVLPFRR
ncbi:hypothetical protein CDL15_Pgr000865 [Punica granatum]|nr:hypothetical protein CDL15_Pgr000865 [Punica granatum]